LILHHFALFGNQLFFPLDRKGGPKVHFGRDIELFFRFIKEVFNENP